jgi:tetratricopeptide (TPR) repeat protein
VAFAVFSNTIDGSFVWDDEQFIERNVYLTSWTHVPALLTQNMVAGAGITSNLYRPFQALTHFMDVRLWGLRPQGHHLTNVLLHAFATGVFFWWLSGLVPLGTAGAVTALFACHPLQSEAVAYISGRGDTLAILFCCLALALSGSRLFLATFCAALAVLSKESLAMFPIFLLLHEHAAGRKFDWRRHAPFWLLSGLYVALRLSVLNFHNTLNFYGQSNVLTEHPLWRLQTYLTTLPKGLLLWLWPSDLHHERSWEVYASAFDARVALSALAAVAWAGAILWSWRRRPVLAAGLAMFVAATLPTSNLVVIINALFYDHWFLLPGVGLALAVCQIPWLREGRALALAVAFGLAFIAAWQARVMNRVWHDPVALYSHILRYEPRDAKIHNNLAMALSDEGKMAEAIEHYRAAIALSDEYPQTHHNLGRAFEQQGRFEDAEAEYRRAIAMSPTFYQSHVALGGLLLRKGNSSEAASSFQSAIAVYPYAAEPYLFLAQMRVSSGDIAGARSIIEKGLEAVDDPRMRLARDQLRGMH